MNLRSMFATVLTGLLSASAMPAFAQSCSVPDDPPFNPPGSELPVTYDCHDAREVGEVPPELTEFAAYYARLPAPDADGDRARDPRDEDFHPIAGPYADVIVNVPGLGRLEFGRRTSYLPVWVPGFSINPLDRTPLPEILMRSGDGDTEKPDRLNRYAYVRILSAEADSAVIHWRYAADRCDPTPSGMVHEYFTVRSDGTVSRTVYPGAATLGAAADSSNNTAQEITLSNDVMPVLVNSTANIARPLTVAGTPAAATSSHPVSNPVLDFRLDDRSSPPAAPVTIESVSQESADVGGRLPSWYAGVSGSALSFDGYTTEVAIEAPTPPTGSFTLEAWVSLAAYPFGTVQLAGHASVDGNIAYSADPVLGNSTYSVIGTDELPILDPFTVGGVGYMLAIDTLGQPNLMANFGGTWFAVEAPRISLHEWHHITGMYDADDGELRLYVDGVETDATATVAGSLVAASAEDVPFVIGLNREPQWVAASGPIHVEAFDNAIFGVEGLIDEVRMYNRALTPADITSSVNRPGAATAASLPPRALPQVNADSGFNLEQRTISYHPAWDQLAHDSDFDDIVVTYPDLPTSVVFWKAMSFAPAWVSENGIWAHDQSMEWGDDRGLSEHMSDKDKRYVHVRVIEDTPARKVVHWRYAPVGISYRLNAPLGDLGWADEYYTLYPDGTTVRYVDDWWCSVEGGVASSFQGTYFTNGPGRRWQDDVQDPIATVMDANGSSIDVSIVNIPPGPVTPPAQNRPENPAVVVTNTLSTHRRYMGLTTGSTVSYSPNAEEVWDMEAVVEDADAVVTPFFRGDHFPVAKIPSDGRFSLFGDRISHSEDFLAIATEQAPAPNKMMLNGFAQSAADALPMVAGWNNAPDVTSSTLTSEGYEKREHAFHFDGPGDALTFELAGDTAIRNPGVVIFGWTGSETPTVTVDGTPVTAASGIHHNNGVRTLVASFPLDASVATIAITSDAGVDTDGDGIVDAADNCQQIANADQHDTNADGFGNACDPDLNNDGIVNVQDLGLLRVVFFTSDADADFNGDGTVNVVDLGLMRQFFFLPPGPSGVAP